MILFNLSLFILACFVLIKSNTILVKSLSKISYYLKLNEFTLGFILVSLATSIPELFVGIMSAFKGIPELSIGNVIGSNIADLTLVVGITVLLARNLHIDSKIIKKDILYMLLISLFPVILIMDHYFWNAIGLFPNMIKGLSRLDGFLLLSTFIVYMYIVVKQESKFSKPVDGNSKKEGLKHLFFFLLSLTILLISANYVVEFAELLAFDLKLSTLIFGLFIVSIGTSLPELMFETKAVLTNHQSMAIGDLVGSVIANSSLILGVTSLIHPIEVNSLIYLTSTLFMIFSAFIFFTFAESGNKLTWKEGLALLMLYCLFIIIQSFIGM